jgi:CheY-like chemotaxis protein
MPTIPEILVIEDNKDDRDLFQRAISRSGLEARITFAVDVTNAISQLNRIGAYLNRPMPDLIVLDLGIHGRKGIMLLDVIRHSLVSKRVPVVILTGSELPGYRAKCEIIGIQDFMIKPMSFAVLMAFIGTLARFFPT